MNDQFCLKLKQKSNKYTSPWKISKVMDNLTVDYYKKYLLTELTNRIESLKPHQEIVIFSESFDMYAKYDDLKTYSLLREKDVLNTYYLGNPISIKPNILSSKITIIFETHRKIFTMLRQYDILIERSNLLKYLKPNLNLDIALNLDPLLEYLNSIIPENNKNSKSIKKKLKNLFDSTQKKFDDMWNHELEFLMIDSFETERELDNYLENDEKRKLYNKGYMQFLYTFNSLSRPTIAILDTKELTVEVLAKEFIKESLEGNNKQKIEMIELHKNSPIVMAFLVGTIVCSWMTSVVVTHLDKLKSDNAKVQTLQTSSSNDVILNFETTLSKFENLSSNSKDINDKIIHIKDFNTRKTIKSANNKITEDTRNTLIKHDFLNDNIDISSLDKKGTTVNKNQDDDPHKI